MPAGKRLWRTADGDLVEEGHPDALTLAYGDGDEPDKGEKVRGSKAPEKVAGKATPKQTSK